MIMEMVPVEGVEGSRGEGCMGREGLGWCRMGRRIGENGRGESDTEQVLRRVKEGGYGWWGDKSGEWWVRSTWQWLWE